ncbi:MAG TPA: hypothetical protein PLP86_12610, partial [Armatimonadota bacterium]|nr:hypothetical protein [Armatimonadota bacterium]
PLFRDVLEFIVHNYKTTTQSKSTEKVGIFQGYLCERVFVRICGCFSSVFETRMARNWMKGTKGYRRIVRLKKFTAAPKNSSVEKGDALYHRAV